ncbi:hypothetical protein GCM10022254_22680 [Actinomadura meridiana]|uniref:Peptidase inhibitor family I36 n=1 Tax=Actinomadura meridiana TaxID=559626 RepID=A0ABP8BXL9_9ACTN
MHRIRIGLLTGAVTAGIVTAAIPSAAALAATTSATNASCPRGDVCVWSGRNATGTRCNWTGDDPDWRGGSIRCKPYGFRVNSIWNNGYTSNPYNKVKFYRNANYSGQISDPVSYTTHPINAANVAIRSHKWSK